MVGMETIICRQWRGTACPWSQRSGRSLAVAPCAIWLLLLLSPLALAQDDTPGQTANPAPETPVLEAPAPDESALETPAPDAPAPNLSAAPVQNPAEQQASAWRMRLTLPVTAKTYKQVKRFAVTALDQASKAQQRPVLIFEFHVPPGQGEFGRGSEFGQSYELAEFLSGGKLAAATTVAFIPTTIQGHAVLVAMACDEIVMAPDAEMGVAGVDEERITNTIRVTYEDIASRKRRIPDGAAMALVDPALELLRVETEYSTEYVTREQFAELKEKKHTVDGSEEILIRAGEPGRFSGREARRHGFISYLGENVRDVARAMNVRPESIQEDPALGANWKAVRIDLVGPITGEEVNRAQRMIDDAIRERGANFICLWLDTEGGAPAESARLAVYLATALDAAEVRTVAYVPNLAGADAALIALACDELVMAPRAVLGGGWNPAPSEDQVRELSQIVRETLAPGKSRSWSLPTAIVDPDLEVFAYQRLEDMKYVEYFCEQEATEQSEPDAWQKGDAITTPGTPLLVTGTVATELWLADHEAEDFTSFKAHYGLENDPDLLEPGWADFLVDALASPPVAVFLLVIGLTALYVEMQIPGIGIGGFCAAVCFIFFFWSRFLGGTAGWLEVILFLAGVCFLLVEIFVLPGFGIFGLGGGLMVLASIILASQTFVLPNTTEQVEQLKDSLFVLTTAGVGSIVLIMLIQRWLPALSPASEAREATRYESLVDYDDLLGSLGTTTTQLTPSGKARFENRMVDVITECEVVERGCQVEVVQVRGNRVFVRPVT